MIGKCLSMIKLLSRKVAPTMAERKVASNLLDGRNGRAISIFLKLCKQMAVCGLYIALSRTFPMFNRSVNDELQ